MSINLFLRPLASANIEYEYKTNVLSTYNNLEDRIAQRDVPRITFNYSYMLNDYGMTNELQNALQNNGSVNSFWLPDWFAFVEVADIVAGTNTVNVDYYNSLTKGEYVLVYADADNYEVTQIDSIDRNGTTCTISFDTTKDFAHACIMPLFECNNVADNKTTYINSLTNTFGVSMMAKQPPLPNILDHDVTFLGHDVFCDNFKVLAEDSEGLEVDAGQQIQENDYEIGIRDRFTFFERMYNTFGLNLCVKQNELEYVRNFLNRRWGMTYACFIPSGSCDFTKVAQTGSIDNVLNVKHSTFDFTHRPYLAIRHGNKVTYAKVLNVVTEDNIDSLTLDSDTMLEVVLNTDEQCVSKSLVTALNCTTFDIDSIQVLYFARLNSDAFSFEFVGNSDDNKCVYKIELSFIETEFYDSSLIDYNNYDGIDIDERTLFEVKATTDDWHNITNDNKKSHFASSQSTGGIAPVLIQGKYDGTYAFANMSIVDTELPPTSTASDHWSDLWMINRDDDFCLQVEGMFVTPTVTAPENQQVSNCSQMLTIGDKNEYYGICIKLAWVFDRYYMTVSFDLDAQANSGNADVDAIVLDKYDGDLFDTFHEIAVQRTNGITYVYCDGHLCGSTMTAKNTRLFRAWARGGDFRKYFYLNLGNTLTSYSADYNSFTASYVQQARVTIKRKVYTHTEMGTMNRQYRLNDYTLTPTIPMDSATVLYEKFIENAVYYRWVLYNGNFYAPDNVNTGGCNHAVHPYARYQRTMVDNANDGWRSWVRGLYTDSSSYRLSQGHDLSRRAYYPVNFKLKMPRMWHKDFWIDFSMSKVGNITNGMTLLNQDGIFLKVWVNSTQTKWMVTAFYDQDPTEEVINVLGKPCDNGEIMNVAIALDSQNNALRTFMDGMEVSVINLTYYMEEFNERACISLYPLYIDQCNIKLHTFRIVDACLAHASYTVSDLDKLGFYTTYFDIEFGQREEDKYPCLRVKDIEEIYPLADIYGVIKNTERVKNYSIVWSDGSKGDTVVNPTGNTLYTCVVTDLSTGQKGYGWYYVPSGFTGKICETDFSYSLSVDSNGDTVKTNHFSAKRYNFLTRAWENYTVGKYGSPSVNFYTTETNGIKGKFYLKRNGGYDYFIDVLTNETLRQAGRSSDNNWYAYHRFYVDHYIKQIEFVVIGDYNNPTYIHNNMAYEYIENLFTCQSEMCDDYDEATQRYYWHRYTDYYNGSGSTPAYLARTSSSRRWYSSSNLKTSITSRYESKYKQGIKYYGMHLSCRSTLFDQGYYPDVENTQYYPLMFTNSPKPIHVVLEVEPMIVGGGASGNNVYCKITSFIRNFWINGKMYDGCKFLKNLDCTNMTNVHYNKLPEKSEDFRMYPDGYNELIRFLCMEYNHDVGYSDGTEFFNNTLGAIAGRFGDYANNNSPDGVTDIKLYNFRKYTKDFDASKILKGTDTQPMLPWRT